MTPECELEFELYYRQCLKCPERNSCPLCIVAAWEGYSVEKYHKQIEENGATIMKGGE